MALSVTCSSSWSNPSSPPDVLEESMRIRVDALDTVPGESGPRAEASGLGISRGDTPGDRMELVGRPRRCGHFFKGVLDAGCDISIISSKDTSAWLGWRAVRCDETDVLASTVAYDTCLSRKGTTSLTCGAINMALFRNSATLPYKSSKRVREKRGSTVCPS